MYQNISRLSSILNNSKTEVRLGRVAASHSRSVWLGGFQDELFQPIKLILLTHILRAADVQNGFRVLREGPCLLFLKQSKLYSWLGKTYNFLCVKKNTTNTWLQKTPCKIEPSLVMNKTPPKKKNIKKEQDPKTKHQTRPQKSPLITISSPPAPLLPVARASMEPCCRRSAGWSPRRESFTSSVWRGKTTLERNQPTNL